MIDVIVGPIEPLQIVVCSQSTVLVVNQGIPGPAASVPDWLDSREKYVSNYEAIHTGGLGVEDWYVAGIGHQAAQAGTLIQILELE